MKKQFRYAARLNSFKSSPELFKWEYHPSDVRDLIRRADLVSLLDAIDLNYPEHFNGVSLSHVEKAIQNTHLKLTGINLRYPEDLFHKGAFTNPDVKKRKAAIELTKAAADVCRELGGDHLVLWLGFDGFDYPFQMDYVRAWEMEIEGIREVANYARDLRVSIEYKISDPRRVSLLGNLGLTLQIISESRCENLGVTIDFCHLLMAHEQPAMIASLAARLGKLFGLHLNDGYGYLDDGLMVGSVSFFQTLEMLFYILQSNCCEVLYFDTFPFYVDPVKECELNIQRVKQMIKIAEQMLREGLPEVIKQQDSLKASEIVWNTVICPMQREL
ncbi:MAG: sugar phosphate isomerase/epimerase family protein [Candidatus Methanomethylicaceae archaeon]